MADEKLTKEQIVEKVKKLLDRANGTNFEQEADTAMKLARELLAKYNLSMADVEKGKTSSTGEKASHKVAEDVQKGWWQPKLGMVVASYTTCVCFTLMDRGIGKVAFVGMPAELEVCMYTFATIARQIDRMARRKRRELRDEREMSGQNRQNRAASGHYTRGYILGIIKFLEDSFKAQVADEKSKAIVIVTHPKVDEWCKHFLKRPSRVKMGPSWSERGYDAGYRDGNKVTVNPGVKSGVGHKQITG